MKKSIKDSIYVDISKAISDALWNEINKWYRQKNIPQLLKDVREALEEYDELLDDKDRLEFEEWIADVEDDLNSPHIEDSIDFDPEDYESFKVVNKTSLNNKQYAMIQAKAIDQNKPDVFYISSSPDMQPENDRRIYVTRAEAEREFNEIKTKSDKRRKDSAPILEKIKSAKVVMDEDSELSDTEIMSDQELFNLFQRLNDKMYRGDSEYNEFTGDTFVYGETEDHMFYMTLSYNEEDDPKKIFLSVNCRINQGDDSDDYFEFSEEDPDQIDIEDAEPFEYFITEYKGTRPQNRHEEEVLDELIRRIITDKGESQGSGEWIYVDQGPVQGAVVYTAKIDYTTNDEGQFEVVVKSFEVEYDSDY